MAKFFKGETVVWRSQAGGYAKEKKGDIVAVVRKRGVPAAKYGIRSSSRGRDHESYVIKVGAKYYWPLVGHLQSVPQG